MELEAVSNPSPPKQGRRRSGEGRPFASRSIALTPTLSSQTGEGAVSNPSQRPSLDTTPPAPTNSARTTSWATNDWFEFVPQVQDRVASLVLLAGGLSLRSRHKRRMSSIPSQEPEITSEWAPSAARYVNLRDRCPSVVAASLKQALQGISGKVLFYKEKGNYFVVPEKEGPTFFWRRLADLFCCTTQQEVPYYAHEEAGKLLATRLGKTGKEIQKRMTTGWWLTKRKQAVEIDPNTLKKFKLAARSNTNADKRKSRRRRPAKKKTKSAPVAKNKETFIKYIKKTLMYNNRREKLPDLLKAKGLNEDDLYAFYQGSQSVSEIVTNLLFGTSATPDEVRSKHIRQFTQVRGPSSNRGDQVQKPEIDKEFKIAVTKSQPKSWFENFLKYTKFQNGDDKVQEREIDKKYKIVVTEQQPKSLIEDALRQTEFRNSDNQPCNGVLIDSGPRGNSFYEAVAKQLPHIDANGDPPEQPNRPKLHERIRTLRRELQQVANEVYSAGEAPDSGKKCESHDGKQEFYQVGNAFVDAKALEKQVKHKSLAADGQPADLSFAALVSLRYKRPVEMLLYDPRAGGVVRRWFAAGNWNEESPLRLAYDGVKFYAIRLVPKADRQSNPRAMALR